jgi:uncharacterized protein
MTNSLIYDASAPVFKRMLTNLVTLLSKAHAHAEAHKYDPDVLLQQRLFPDMFPLIRQIQIACDAAKLAVARLARTPAPVHADDEKTLAGIQVRIRETIDFIASVPAIAFDGCEERVVEIKQRDKVLSMDGRTYLLTLALPNFYFHLTTAYNLLRHNGVAIGKRDFLGSGG